LAFGRLRDPFYVSPDLGRIPDRDRRTDLLEMCRAAISYLDSLHDPAVRPLRQELSRLQRRLADQGHALTRPERSR